MQEKTLVRVVRLTLHPEEVDRFLTLFDSISSKIRNFDGCQHLELLQDSRFPNIVATYSHWESVYALEAYRHSELFKSTWSLTKAMFAAPPIAYSYDLLRRIN